MGYPMTWARVMVRNYLQGGYSTAPLASTGPEVDAVRRSIAGDFRRLEADTLDPRHTLMYAYEAGVSEEAVRRLFGAFFNGKFTPGIWDMADRELTTRLHQKQQKENGF